jgi:hypothetical protein
MEQLQEDEEYGDATDYVESYFDNGETDEAFDDDGGKLKGKKKKIAKIFIRYFLTYTFLIGGGEAYFD